MRDVRFVDGDEGDPWPNCKTPDCENKRCCWSGTVYCFPCAELLLGREALIGKYDATHERTWAQMEAEDAAVKAGTLREDDRAPNYWNGEKS